jgi:hypothetical protein
MLCFTPAKQLGNQGRYLYVSIQNHLRKLQEKHAAVDADILLLQACPGHDSLRVKELKKQKMLIKEDIHRLQNPARVSLPKAKKKAQKAKPPKEATPALTVVSSHAVTHRSESGLDQRAA